MLDSTEHPADPIAVVGIGCRLPGGVTDPNSLWTVLTKGVDAIKPVPAERWDVDRFYSPQAQQSGRMSAREGGFLDSVDTFDAEFFGISGRVAEQMDPQQRVLLEVAWAALEDAGVVPADLAGGKTGVFMGACSQDYGGLQSALGEVESLGAHSATGTFMSILSNRLSYTLDLRGPSMTIDTACSSSLVAVHLACQSLQRGESEVALAGGVNVILTPQFAIALSQAAMLSPDARSRAFDAGANGYVRGEGAGVVVLKPLSAALRDQDRVYAVLHGSAVNQDGRTSGITLPSGSAQEANFREALSSAGIAGNEIGYVEAHGTGTPVGDPIEANALGRVLGEDREVDQPAYLGSIKTNIGHLEAGAGVAGLIKAVLSVHHRQILPSLHFRAPNPEIDFESARMVVPTEVQPWPAQYPRALAAVNSFGFGGTNANVIVGEVPVSSVDESIEPPVSKSGTTPNVITFSARNAKALDQLTGEVADQLEREDVDIEQLGAYFALRRSHHSHRLAVVASDTTEVVTKLRQYANEGAAAEFATGAARTKQGKLAFLFNGQGPQWYAMGRTLLETSPVYRAKIMECDELARPYLGWSIYEALTADEATSRVQETHCLQPTIFALQVALAELWKSWGVVPDAVLGHSMGEIAAAYISGSLDLDTALKVICHRSRIQEKADSTGAMMFVALGKESALKLCARHPDELWLSAENSPQASTLSGRRDLLEKVAAELTEQGTFARILKVNCACHSSDMEPLREELVSTLDGVQGSPSSIPMYSTVIGGLIDGTALNTDYWWQNFRKPVLFEPGIRAMLADGFDCFIELSPHPVLGNSLQEILADVPDNPMSISSLSRKKDDWSSFLGAFSDLYTSGRQIEWTRRYPDGVAATDFPTNPWIRERYWNESEVSLHHRAGGQPHPMLKSVDAVRPTWEIKWDDHRLSWVKEHDVLGSVLVPGASYVEAALVAARELTGGPCGLDFVEFERACVLDPEEPRVSRIELNPEDGTFVVHHRATRASTWTRAVHGRFHRDPGSRDPGSVESAEHTELTRAGERRFDLAELRSRCEKTFSAADVYSTFRDKGYRYGPSFCGIERLYVGPGETLARITVPRGLRKKLDGYLFHPAVLDACFQSSILHPVDEQLAELLPFTYLPTGIDGVRFYSGVGTAVWCYTKAHKLDASGLLVSIYVLDEEGRLVAEYTRLHGKVVPSSGGEQSDQIQDHLYQLSWQLDRTAQVSRPLISALTETPSQISSELSPQTQGLADRLSRHSYANEYQDALHKLCAAYIFECLERFGRPLHVGESFTVVELSGLVSRFDRALTGFLNGLVQDGILSEQDGLFRVERVIPESAEALWARAFTDFPASAWELLLLRKTGSSLHEVLTGQADPLTLLFPEGSQDETEPIYQSSPIARFYNLAVERAVRRLAETADLSRTLRVLEVGAGTGGLTSSVLRALPADRCEYVFTDVSPAFFPTAEERFGQYAFVEYKTLDLERDLEEQGFDLGSFDLVLASDVVHATEDLKRTLFHLQDALAPGGMLILLEAAPGNRWLDLTFGLTVGWWSFRDLGLRREGPLLTAKQWQDVLESAHYSDVVSVGDPGHQGPGSQSILMAQAPDQELAIEPPRAVGSSTQVGEWVILASPDDPLAKNLVQRITSGGGRAILAEPFAQDFDQLLASANPQGVIEIMPEAEKSTVDGFDGEAGIAEGTQACLATSQMLQALARKFTNEWPRLFVLTRGVHSVRNTVPSLTGAPLWGFGTVAGLEFPQAQYTMIDLASESEVDQTDSVWAELWSPDNEREIALRGGDRFVRRLVSLPADEITPTITARELPEQQGYVLELGMPGALDELHFAEVDRVTPTAEQVEIQVVAGSLNFLDVMIALGQVPLLESAHSFRFGAECSGIVTRVGENVQGLRVGDPVIAVNSTQGALASHLTLDATNVVAKPESLSFEEASSIPIVFLTAWYALHQLARVRAGDRVLIHSAAGGTGLAAIQLAQRAGVEIFATAGTPQKRALLRSLGVQHVMDSRSLDFVDEIRRVTDGEGVDVVLNSIAGESAVRSLDCLAPYGRFVEIGKRDLLDDRKLGLRPFLRNLSYFSFDLRQLLDDRPKQVRAEFEELMKLFAKGELKPLPYRVFHPDQTESAFRQMAAARHIGKLVISMDERDIAVTRASAKAADLTGTWLITGGLGGFGLAMAGALADSGVRDLVLIGRSGVPSAEAQSQVDALRARGVQVLIEAVDVASKTQLTDLFARIEQELPPLNGVLHCAMVLDDVWIPDLDQDRLDRVIQPKALGAWYLHELTEKLSLQAFVLFSSATSMIGNAGQANYGAANAFLDHLADFRRAQGLPALAINWGAISDAGYVARHQDIARLVASTGMRDFTAAEAYQAMTSLWQGSYPNAGVLPMDWPRFFQHYGFDQDNQPRYAELYQAHGANASDVLISGGSLRQQMKSQSDETRSTLLKAGLKARLATVLGMPIDELNDDKPLMDYLDSLLVVEINVWLERELDVKVTILELMKGPSLNQLTEQLLVRLEQDSSSEAAR